MAEAAVEDDNEIEVEASQVFQRNIKLYTQSGTLFSATLTVFEVDRPVYCLVFQIDTEHSHSLRMEVFKDELSTALKEWLAGHVIRNPARIISPHVEEAISLFVRYGHTPKQVDLIYWILSRTEVILGSNPQLIFGGAGRAQSTTRSVDLSPSRGSSADFRLGGTQNQQEEQRQRPRSAPTKRQTFGKSHEQLFEESQKLRSQILGSSKALTELKRQTESPHRRSHSNTRPVRPAAIKTFDTSDWTDEHFRLVSHIKTIRRDISETLEKRRHLQEIAKYRQKQVAVKNESMRSRVSSEANVNRWVKIANNEITYYKQILKEAETDLVRQTGKTMRACEKLRHTATPNGYMALRRSNGTQGGGGVMKGPYLGPGPLPIEAIPAATQTARVAQVDNNFMWDTAGRRHFRTNLEQGGEDDGDAGAKIERAMNAIKKAAANVASYRLNLKNIFNRFDESGDGKVDLRELQNIFLQMNVHIDQATFEGLFKVFDANGDGFITYGEFLWSFFNRRKLFSQWKKTSQSMTPQQIEAKFHAADINGDNLLNKKEFKNFLKSLKISLSDSEVDSLFKKFDSDGNGVLDLREFLAFMQSEDTKKFEEESKKQTVEQQKEKSWNNTVSYKVAIPSLEEIPLRRGSVNHQSRTASMSSNSRRGSRSSIIASTTSLLDFTGHTNERSTPVREGAATIDVPSQHLHVGAGHLNATM